MKCSRCKGLVPPLNHKHNNSTRQNKFSHICRFHLQNDPHLLEEPNWEHKDALKRSYSYQLFLDEGNITLNGTYLDHGSRGHQLNSILTSLLPFICFNGLKCFHSDFEKSQNTSTFSEMKANFTVTGEIKSHQMARYNTLAHTRPKYRYYKIEKREKRQ